MRALLLFGLLFVGLPGAFAQEVEEDDRSGQVDAVLAEKGIDPEVIEAGRQAEEKTREAVEQAADDAATEANARMEEAQAAIEAHKQTMDEEADEFLADVKELCLYLTMAFGVFAFFVKIVRLRQVDNMPDYFRAMAYFAAVFAVIIIFESQVMNFREVIDDLTAKHGGRVEAMLDYWSDAKVVTADDGAWSATGIFNSVKGALVTVVFQGAILYGHCLRWIIQEVVFWLIRLMMIFSPMLLAMLLLDETRDVGVRYLTTVLGFILLPIGFCLGDYLIVKVAVQAFSALGVFGGVSDAQSTKEMAVAGLGLAGTGVLTTTAPVIFVPAALQLALFFLVAFTTFYLMMPLAMIALFRGGNPATAAQSALATSNRMARPLRDLVRSMQDQLRRGGMSGDNPMAAAALAAGGPGAAAAVSGLSPLESAVGGDIPQPMGKGDCSGVETLKTSSEGVFNGVSNVAANAQAAPESGPPPIPAEDSIRPAAAMEQSQSASQGTPAIPGTSQQAPSSGSFIPRSRSLTPPSMDPTPGPESPAPSPTVPTSPHNQKGKP